MQYTFILSKFETRAERPLFTGDVSAYALRVVLPQEVDGGLLTVAAFRPNTKNPVLASSAFSGDVAEVTLRTEQYDTTGETKFLCTVTDSDGGVLTTRVLYATVLAGLSDGTVASDDRSELSALIADCGSSATACVKATESAAQASQNATQAAKEANEAAQAAKGATIWRAGNGKGSVVFGSRYNQADGDGALAGGYRGVGYDGEPVATEAEGTAAIAHGAGVKTYAHYGVSFGALNTVGQEGKPDVGANGFTAGYGNTILGKNAAGFGQYEEIDGPNAFGGGSHNKVHSYGCGALGYGNEVGNSTEKSVHAEGMGAATLGANNKIPHTKSVGVGVGLNSGASEQTLVGRYNEVDPAASFVLGSGTSDDARKNAITVDREYTDTPFLFGQRFVWHGEQFVIQLAAGTLPKNLCPNKDEIRLTVKDGSGETVMTVKIGDIWRGSFNGKNDAIRIPLANVPDEYKDSCRTWFSADKSQGDSLSYIHLPTDRVIVHAKLVCETIEKLLLLNGLEITGDTIQAHKELIVRGGADMQVQATRCTVGTAHGFNISSLYGPIRISSEEGSVYLKDVVTPTEDTDGVNKQYVDALVEKLTAAIQAIGGTVA